MVRRLGLLVVVLSFVVLPQAQDNINTVRGERASKRMQPHNPVLDASNHGAPDWEHSTREERARRQAQMELAKQQLRKLHEETAQLVALANELKADLDKSAAEKLSVDAMKKTEQIEKLAKNIRQRMKTL